MGLSNLQIGIWNVLGAFGFIPAGGNHYWVNPSTGGDGNNGSQDAPFATLYKAISVCTAGNNDVVHLVSDGTTATTARLTLANAQSVTPSATVGTLVWNKNATHLVGECAPCVDKRARIAPPATTYTMATFNSGNFVNVTGHGCVFANFSVWGGFSTGGASEITWTDAGRNFYYDVVIAGLADAASATSTTGRSLLLTGNIGESVFVKCVIGTDTVTRTVANATVEFAGGTPRNKFYDCEFPIWVTSAATPLHFIASAASAMDRYQLMERCLFVNAVKSTGITQTALATLAASAGGMLVFKDCCLVGVTGFGSDATSRGQIYIEGGTPAAATTGLAVAPTA